VQNLLGSSQHYTTNVRSIGQIQAGVDAAVDGCATWSGGKSSVNLPFPLFLKLFQRGGILSTAFEKAKNLK
jgi:hypothetical protein